MKMKEKDGKDEVPFFSSVSAMPIFHMLPASWKSIVRASAELHCLVPVVHSTYRLLRAVQPRKKEII